MSRSKYTNECSIPNQRGRKQIMKCKRLSSKKVRSMPIETDVLILKRIRNSVMLDKDPVLNSINSPNSHALIW